MISTENAFFNFVQFVAPLVYRSETKIAAKLKGFAATEAGSALDMLKAAELEADPRRRKLFFRHAMDEARHSNYFRDQARQVDPGARAKPGAYNLIHATRQNLYQNLDLIEFVAFVYLAEKRGELHFRSLIKHFEDRPEIRDMFQRIVKDEVFHVRYSNRLLEEWRRAGKGKQVSMALRKIKMRRAWEAWKRSGRQIGDLMSNVLLALTYFVVLPVFSLVQRVAEPEKTGWKDATPATPTVAWAKRLY